MIRGALKKASGLSEIHLEVPDSMEHGDYSSNVAMVLFSRLKKKESKSEFAKFHTPKQLADELVQRLSKDKVLNKTVSKIEVAGPGFINFWIKENELFKQLENVVDQKENYGKSDAYKDKRVMVEFGQPNTHKLPHIGHLFSYIYGESIARIIKTQGATLFRANYQGDIGLHVAKCLWAYKEKHPDVPNDLVGKVDLLQDLYQEGSKAYDEDEKAKSKVDKLNKDIYEKDDSVAKLWGETRKWSIDYYKRFEKDLGVTFDRYYYESEVQKKGKKLVEANLEKVFEKSQGAIVFKGSRFGLHDRVFITKKGIPTYEAKDMYLQTLKMKEWPYDLLIITTASEQNDYFKVIFKALEEIDSKFKGKLKHIGFGMVNLKKGKLSSRKGDIVGAVELVEMAVKEIEKIVKVRKDLSEKEKREIAQKVGMAAVKYSFLKNNPLQDVNFDFEESISMEGNSGPYLQYTYARIQSLLEKANTKATAEGRLKANEKFNKEELDLVRSFIHYPEVVREAAEKYSPNLICNYLFELAQRFNNFYNKHDILEERTKDKSQSQLRLVITTATGKVIKNGLDLLGIQVLNRM
jgi:arginyl-tRNA synthetase